MFADEPTGSLNSSQGESVLDIFTTVHAKWQSVVMVTHDLKAALRENQILYITDGRIDGDLSLTDYGLDGLTQREDTLYKFLKSKDW